MQSPIHLLTKAISNPSKIPPYIKNSVYEYTWPIIQNYGWNITRNHFYYPIPDLEDLEEKRPWDKKFPDNGIQLNDGKQKEFLREGRSHYQEYSDTDIKSPQNANGFPSGADGPILYSMVRRKKPNRIIEVGSGQSTRISLQASKKNAEDGDSASKILSIEPYPEQYLSELDRSYDNYELLSSRAEDVSVERYLDLEEGDILFIDATHTITTGSDVTHLFLRILPQLPSGVFIHIHDIHFPYDYPKEWLVEHNNFWTEQYLLQAFLMFNDSFEVIWSGHYMGQKYGHILEDSIDNYQSNIEDNRGQSCTRSFWIKKSN